MPQSCVVPNCKTGYKSVKIKRSTFKVPKKIDLLKKWQAAIPGNIKLKSSHFVCERHFDEQYINRQWVKHDLNGKIIAQYTYLCPRLHDGAVPTLFNDEIVASKQTVTENSDTKSEVTFTDNFSVVENITIDEILPNNHAEVKTENSLMDYSPAVENVSSILLDESSIVDKVDVKVENDANSMDDGAIIENTEFILQQHSPTTAAQLHQLHQIPVSASALETREKSVNVSTAVISEYHELLKSATLLKNWGVTEIHAHERQYVLFTYSVMRVKNGVDSPIALKNITLDTQGKLRYYVYGNPVDENDTDLVQFLNNTVSLPIVLERFQHKSMCSGIRNINVHCIPEQSAFSDYVDGWRANKCSLLSKTKRCDHCNKLRRTVLYNEKKLKSCKAVNRVLKSPNPIYQTKFASLKKKLKNQTRKAKRAKCRVELLMQSLKNKKAEIAAIQDQTLRPS